MKKKILFIALGAGAGFAYYYFIGCNNGSCLIQSNPYISSTYGAAVGWAVSTVTLPLKKNKKDTDSSI
ncbi:hypothetical protein F9K33_10510 [bacterium]|nr:MAG: hypothetical protein F9K33_10510 [bacterium]